MWTLKSVSNFRPVLVSAEGEAEVPVYRSGRLDGLKEEDLEKYKALGIRTVIDLREIQDEFFSDAGRKGKYVYEHSCIKSVMLPSATYSSTDDVQITCVGDENDHNKPSYIFLPVVNFAFIKSFLQKLPNTDIMKAIFYARLLKIWFWKSLGYHADYMSVGQDVGIYITGHTDINPRASIMTYMIDNCAISIVACLKMLCNSDNLPAVFCCNAGKDRTGAVSAILLSILGVHDQIIADDYMKSKAKNERLFQMMLKHYPHEGIALRKLLDTQEEDILKPLEHIRKRYGSVDDYLDLNGFNKENRTKLKERLHQFAG